MQNDTKNQTAATACDIIICTKNRPEDVRKNLESVCIQTIQPAHVIIIDASDNNATKEICIRFNPELKIIYKKSDIAGLTRQRNIGIEQVKSPITIFLDDDVIMEKDYVKETLKIYHEHPDVGGVSGNMVNQPPLSRPYYIFKKIFFLSGLTRNRPNHVQKSGFPMVTTIQDKITEETFMEGGLCSYKKEILDKYSFDENLRTYAYMEDVDYSYRVSKKYKLMRTPLAKLNHYPSTSARINFKKVRAMLIFNHYYLFKKNLPQGITFRLAHLWSQIGLLLEAIVASVAKRNFSYISGNLLGYRQILTYIFNKKFPVI